MNLILKRTEFHDYGVIGELLTQDGFRKIAMTLEHSYSPENQPKVPKGIYTCQRGIHRLASQRKEFETFEILKVPGHTGILFHVGNYETDSSGCVLLGDSVSYVFLPWMLKFSRIAFTRFMSLQEGIDTFQLEVQ